MGILDKKKNVRKAASSLTTHARLGFIARLHQSYGPWLLLSEASSTRASDSFGVHASHIDAAYAVDADYTYALQGIFFFLWMSILAHQLASSHEIQVGAGTPRNRASTRLVDLVWVNWQGKGLRWYFVESCTMREKEGEEDKLFFSLMMLSGPILQFLTEVVAVQLFLKYFYLENR